MKYSEFKNLIDRVQPIRNYEDPDVVIQISLPYSTVGGIPTVKVESAFMGIDWDSGKFIIKAEENLTPKDRDFAKMMQDMQKKYGQLAYENRGLKSEIKKLKQKIKMSESNDKIN